MSSKLLSRWGGAGPVERAGALLAVACLVPVVIWIAASSPYDNAIERAVQWFVPGVGEGHRPPITWALRGVLLGVFLRFGWTPTWGWLSRDTPRTRSHSSAADTLALHFKGPEEALEYACKSLASRWDDGVVVPGVVDDIAVSPLGDGALMASVRVCAAGGPVAAVAAFPAGKDMFDPEVALHRLCAILIGPVVPLSDGMRAMVVIGVLNPSWRDGEGWQVQRLFKPRNA